MILDISNIKLIILIKLITKRGRLFTKCCKQLMQQKYTYVNIFCFRKHFLSPCMYLIILLSPKYCKKCKRSKE